MKICGAVLLIIIVLGIAGFWKKRITIILVVLSGVSLAAAFAYEVNLNNNRITFIKRSEAGEENIKKSVVAKTKDGRVELEIEVPKKDYTEEEAIAILDKEINNIKNSILGKNKSFTKIEYDMTLPQYGQNENVSIEWLSSDIDIISSSGEIKDNADENGNEAALTAILTLGDYERRYEQSIVVYQRAATGNLKNDIEEAVKRANRENDSDKYFLPEKAGDESLLWYESSENNAPYVSAFVLIFGLFIVWADRKRREDKERIRIQSLKKEYSELISRLVLLLYAGQTMRMAFFSIAESYSKAIRKNNIQRNEAFEEILIACKQMKSGTTEVKAYENLADRCALPCYRTLSILLIQNQKRGSKGMIQTLELEVMNEFAEKKRMVKSTGEIASMKLMIPLGMMLMIVFALLMIPAFFSL